MTNIAIETGDLEWIFPLKMVIFHSYASLPEGKVGKKRELWMDHMIKLWLVENMGGSWLVAKHHFWGNPAN